MYAEFSPQFFFHILTPRNMEKTKWILITLVTSAPKVE